MNSGWKNWRWASHVQAHGAAENVLALRFGEGRTQMEVASDIGISQAQVSRLEKAPSAR